MSVVELAEKASEVFVFSDSFLKIKELIDEDTSTIDDIAGVIMLDPALSATVLKLANSPLFNYPGKIETISKGVLVLGISEVYNLVIAFFATETFKSMKVNTAYLDAFWDRSVRCALLIKYLGGRLKIPNAERLFILGLLHDLGHLVVLQFIPKHFLACHCKDLTELPWAKQQRLLGFSYGTCTAELLKSWHLPYSLIGPIKSQDDYDSAAESKESQLLYIAKRIMLQSSVYIKEPDELLLSDEQMALLSITPDMVEEALAFSETERLSLLNLLKPQNSA